MDSSDITQNNGKSLISRVTEAAQGLQVTERAQRQFQKVETRFLKELQTRLDRVAGSAVRELNRTARATASATAAKARTFVAMPLVDEPARVLQDLLERSRSQLPDEARDELFCAVLKGLVPDEARILSALADGTVYPLVHVGIGPPVGKITRYVLENASCIGKSAGLTLPQMTPTYLQRLHAQGLVAFGPEDEAAAGLYKLTEADEPVISASKQAAQHSRFRARIERRSVRLSAFGAQLWRAAQSASGGSFVDA